MYAEYCVIKNMYLFHGARKYDIYQYYISSEYYS